jgi:hypothetical protein
MSDVNKQAGNSALSQTVQPLLWFLLLTSALACASSFALGMVS